MLKDRGSSVLLKILIIRDQLNDSVPNFGSDMITSGRDELQDGVDIPLVLRPVS
jgi:hypothetical protein